MMMRSCVQLPGRESLPNNRPWRRRWMFSPLRRLPQQRTRHTEFVSAALAPPRHSKTVYT